MEGADAIGGVNGKIMWKKMSGRSTTYRRVVSEVRETTFRRGGERLAISPEGGPKIYGANM